MSSDGSPLFTAELNWPPSMNHYWRHVTIRGSLRVLISAEGRQYRREVIAACYRDGPRLTDRLHVRIGVWVPDRRRRDLDNLLKPLLDAITHAGIWEDDSQIKHLEIVEFGREPPDGRIFLEVRPATIV